MPKGLDHMGGKAAANPSQVAPFASFAFLPSRGLQAVTFKNLIGLFKIFVEERSRFFYTQLDLFISLHHPQLYYLKLIYG